MSSPNAVVDTVVLRYFLLAERADLLIDLLGSPIGAPRVVFDPEDEGAPIARKSEMRGSVARQQRRAGDMTFDQDERLASAERARRLALIDGLYAEGRLTVLDLDEGERKLAAQLTSPSGCKAFGLRFPLHAGESACLALAVRRELILVTDDNDALAAAATFAPAVSYERIRKLLVRASQSGQVSQDEANALHRHMTDQGFRDNQLPFPNA